MGLNRATQTLPRGDTLNPPLTFRAPLMDRELPPALQVTEQPRRLELHRYQWVGLPLMLLIPVLALFGVFGETWGRADDVSADLALRVEYPTRYRYKQINALEVFVENVSGGPLDTVVVAFDPAYVLRFSTPTFIPAPEVPYEVELLDVQPGEVRLVVAELQGERYGRHRGAVEAYRPGSSDTARVAVSTIIFP